ncbi:MAG: hypothetical protein ABRQ37_21555 [Candidatus Eremiobacterota bacterium]
MSRETREILHQESGRDFLSGVYFFNEAENTIEIIERDKKKIFGVKDGKIKLLNTIEGEVNMQIVYSYNFPEIVSTEGK